MWGSIVHVRRLSQLSQPLTHCQPRVDSRCILGGNALSSHVITDLAAGEFTRLTLRLTLSSPLGIEEASRGIEGTRSPEHKDRVAEACIRDLGVRSPKKPQRS